MIHLTSGIGLVLEVGLAVFCFVDVLLAREAAVRLMPRWGWVVAILVFPVAGCVGYLVAGRPWRASERAGRSGSGTAVTTTGTDAGTAGRRSGAVDAPTGDTGAGRPADGDGPDDASLLVLMSRLNDEHEQMLNRWESDLRRREAALRDREQDGSAAA